MGMSGKPDLLQRYRGAMLGLAVGDALGTSVEFCPRGSFTPLTDMCGGGPFGLAAGAWTDDTSMALCLAESLLQRGGFDARDQMGRYMNWWQWGYLSSTGVCFDIGMTVQAALSRYAADGNPFAGDTDPRSAGNGSIMRLAPVVLFYFPDQAQVWKYSAQSSQTTHAAAEAVEACQLLGMALMRALQGQDKAQILQLADLDWQQDSLRTLASAAYLHKSREQISGSGYVLQSLEAALWCFAHSRSYDEAVLLAANLGDDADTTAAVAGQLAGAYYGEEGINASWRARLHMGAEIRHYAQRLYAAAGREAEGLPRTVAEL